MVQGADVCIAIVEDKLQFSLFSSAESEHLQAVFLPEAEGEIEHSVEGKRMGLVHALP